MLLLQVLFVGFSWHFIGCRNISSLSLLKKKRKNIISSRIIFLERSHGCSSKGKDSLCLHSPSGAHFSVCPCESMVHFWSKSGSTGPAVTRLELQKVAYINSFLTIDLRITVSQHHCPSFTISSKYILHINFWSVRTYFDLCQWFTRPGQSSVFLFSLEILTFPDFVWCESE